MADSSLFASGGAKFPKMGEFVPRTPLNHHVKFDAVSFILAGEIRNHTNTQTNSKRYIHTLPIGIVWIITPFDTRWSYSKPRLQDTKQVNRNKFLH